MNLFVKSIFFSSWLQVNDTIFQIFWLTRNSWLNILRSHSEHIFLEVMKGKITATNAADVKRKNWVEAREEYIKLIPRSNKLKNQHLWVIFICLKCLRMHNYSWHFWYTCFALVNKVRSHMSSLIYISHIFILGILLCIIWKQKDFKAVLNIKTKLKTSFIWLMTYLEFYKWDYYTYIYRYAHCWKFATNCPVICTVIITVI